MTKTPEELTAEWYSKKLQAGSFWFVETKYGYPEPMVVDIDGDFNDLEGKYYMPSLTRKGWLKVLAPCDYDEYKAIKEQLNKEGTWYTEISYKKLKKELESARWYQTVQNEDIAKLRQLLKEGARLLSFEHETYEVENFIKEVNEVLK